MLFSFSFLLISCSGSDTIEYQDFQEQPFSFGGSYTNLWNPANPYDSLGYKHNKMCDDIFAQYVSSTGAVAFAYRLDTLVSDLLNTEYSYTISPQTLRDTVRNYVQEIVSAFEDSLTFAEYLDTKFTSIVADTLDRIFQIVAPCSTSNQIEMAIQQIKIIESAVSNNSYFTQHEKNVVFAAAAVTKFSLVYWHDALNNPYSELNVWYDDYENEEEVPNGVYEIVGFVLLDAMTAANEIDKGSDTRRVIGKAVTCSMGIAFSNPLFAGLWTIGSLIINWILP